MPSKKSLSQDREAVRGKHLSLKTVKAYLCWARRFILIYHKHRLNHAHFPVHELSNSMVGTASTIPA